LLPSNKVQRGIFLSLYIFVISFFGLFSTVYLNADISQPYEVFDTNTTTASTAANTPELILNATNEQPRNNTVSNNTIAFLTYLDPIYGIKIGYPSNWNTTEGANFVEFRIPTADYNRANITDLIALEIRIDILPPSITSVEQYSRAKLISHRQFGEFNLLESNAITIAANVPALKTVYTNTFPKTGEVLMTMEITAIKDNIGYDIRYFADPASDYPKYLPIVQKMIDSFEFIGLTES
jgi:hypothetical protein